MSWKPPSRFDSSERQFNGLTYRQVAILATAGLVALGCLLGLKTWPLWVRIGLVLVCTGVALFWAFWQANGQTLEAQLGTRLSFRQRIRTLLHRALREPFQGKVTLQDAEPPTQAAAKTAGRTLTLDWWPGVLWITANTLGISILSGLTLWLYQGGAHQLELIWSKL
jgi:hypothetical protein